MRTQDSFENNKFRNVAIFVNFTVKFLGMCVGVYMYVKTDGIKMVESLRPL